MSALPSVQDQLPLAASATPPAPHLSLSSFLSTLLRPCLYTSAYGWLIALATLDLFLTGIILWLGGREANALARLVIETGGIHGMITFKLGALLLVLAICEFVGRHRERLGRRIALIAVAGNTVAAAMGVAYLALYSSAAYV